MKKINITPIVGKDLDPCDIIIIYKNKEYSLREQAKYIEEEHSTSCSCDFCFNYGRGVYGKDAFAKLVNEGKL